MRRAVKDQCRHMAGPTGILGSFLLIFAVVFYLYGVPVETILYGVVICALAGMVYFIIGVTVYLRKYERLQVLWGELEGNLGEMPPAGNGIEAQYQQMLADIHEKRKQLDARWSVNYEDLMEYYTTWAHQIKTPIAAMRLLLQARETEENRRLEAELFKIEQYVEMALGYLRTEDMSKDLQIREYDLDGIIRQAVKKYAKLFIMKKVTLSYTGVGTMAITDEKWLVFVLEQLLSNAVKYTGEGGTVSIYMEEGQPKTLVIADTGIGISAQDLPRVCEKGFTGYNGRTDKRATGIGLYSAKKVMDRLGHGIYLTSRVGEGTQVHLNLNRERFEIE